MKKVSFDFDSTLSIPTIQDYAASLLSKGFDLWVITSRFPPGTKPKHSIRGIMQQIDNSDLFKVTDELGIKRNQIIFTSHVLKSDIINEMSLDLILHIDDDWVELNHINSKTKTKGISCFGNNSWKQKCNKILMG